MRVVVPLLCVVLAALAPAAVAAQPDDTSIGYLVNAAHTGEVPNSTLTPPLAVAWTRTDLGQASYPVVAAGKIVVVVPRPEPTVVALDVRTGATLWTVALGVSRSDDGQAWIAYEDGHVFAVGRTGVLRALDIDTGAQVWQTTLPNDVSSAPTVRDGVIYLEAYQIIHAVRASNGSVIWTSRPYGVGGNSSPAVTADGVYFGWACENTYRLNPANGAFVWRHQTGCTGGGGESPSVAGGRVYVQADFWNEKLALDAADGREVEQIPAMMPPAFTGTTRLTLPSWNLSNGTWTFAGDEVGLMHTVIANGVAYVASQSGRVYGVNPATGAQVWKGFAGARVPQFNDSDGKLPWAGIGAGQGVLVIPTVKGVTAFVEEAKLPPWTPIEPAPGGAGPDEADDAGAAVAASGESAPARAPHATPPLAAAPFAAAPRFAPLITSSRGRTLTVRTRLAAPARVTLTISRRGKRLARVTKDARAGALTLRATVRARGRLKVTVQVGDFTRVSSITR